MDSRSDDDGDDVDGGGGGDNDDDMMVMTTMTTMMMIIMMKINCFNILSDEVDTSAVLVAVTFPSIHIRWSKDYNAPKNDMRQDEYKNCHVTEQKRIMIFKTG